MYFYFDKDMPVKLYFLLNIQPKTKFSVNFF